MSNLNLEYTRNVVNGIRSTFLSGPPPPPPPPTIDPNLLFDVKFDNSLDVDYSKDGSALTFEAKNGAFTPNDGFITVNPNNYLRLTTGLPSYIKHTGDQSWVVNFQTNTSGATRFVVHTAPPEGSRETTLLIRTGIFLLLYGTTLYFTVFKGPGDVLVDVPSTIGDVDLTVNVNSVVGTYRRSDHMSSLYFNGVLIKQLAAPAGNEASVMDWSTADNLYVNKSFRFTPNQNTDYHKITAYDKILTPEEIVDIYNASQL